MKKITDYLTEAKGDGKGLLKLIGDTLKKNKEFKNVEISKKKGEGVISFEYKDFIMLLDLTIDLPF